VRLRVVITIIAAATIVACNNPTGPDAVVGTPFALEVGATASLPDDAQLRFDGVRADSRCPIDAVCITAGDATIAVTLMRGSSREARELHTMPAQSQFSYSQYTVRLTELQPYPQASRPTKPEDYVATFIVQNQ
jgi:hypothetical protein